MSLELLIDAVDQICNLVYPTLAIEQRADAFVSTASFQLLDETASLSFEEKQIVLIQDGAEIYFAGTIANVQSENLAEGTESLVHTIQCQDYNIQVEEVVIDQLEEYGGVADNVIIDDLFDTYLPEINTHDPVGGGYVQHLHVFAEIDFYAITLREALDRIATEVESTALAGLWYIDYQVATKYLHYFAVEDNAPAWSLSDTPDYVNSFPYLSAVRKDRQGAAIVNRILVCGADVDLFVQDQDSHDYYGKWFEAIVRDNTLLGVQEVIDHGNSLLTKWAYPDEAYEVITRQPGLRAGMNIEFNCALFGTADRVNLVENPSFEVNVADFWTFVEGGFGGGVSRNNAHFSVGNWAARLLATSVGDSELRSDNIAVATGETITVQARLYRATAVVSDIEIYDVTNGVSRATATPALTGTFEFLTVSWTNPGAAVNISFRLRNRAPATASNIWFDGCMAEINKGPKPVEYIDGTLPYCTWDGAAHDSTSRRPPVYMIKQLTLTWPENTPTWALTLGGKVTQTALISARNTQDGVLSGLGPVVDGQVPLASRGWSHDLVFSAVDNDTVAWTAGDIITAANQTFSIAPGANTGAMAPGVVHYIYLDTDTSLTALQLSAGTAVVGGNIILVAVAAPNADAAKDATFQVFGGEGVGVFITADNIAANTITANEIAANTITAAEIAANTITAAQIAALTITAAEIVAATLTADKLSIGESFYNAADGIMLYNGHCEVNVTEWWSTSRQMATLSGAIHQARSRWQGTRALVVEPGNKNYVKNPSFEVNVTDDWTLINGARARDTTYYYVGSASCKLTAHAAASSIQESGFIAVANGETVTAHCRCLRLNSTTTGGLVIRDTTTPANRSTMLVTEVGTWQYLEVTWTNTTGGAVNVAVRLYNTTADGASLIYYDAVQMEWDQDWATHYFDGTFGSGYVWDVPASPHNSYSTRTKTTVNLNAYANLLSSRNTFSIRMVAQMPFDADGNWVTGAPPLFDTRAAADNNNRIAIQFVEGGDDFRVYINGAYRLDGSLQTFDRGGWVDLVVTFDFAADDYNLYVNGVLDDNDTTALVAPTGLTLMYLGTDISTTLQSGFAFAEFAVFDKVLTQIEVSQLYNLQRPLIDSGTELSPGIYILDGKFSIASSTSGNRIEIVADEIAGYSSAGVKQFYLSSADGVAYAGAGKVWLDVDGLSLEQGAGGESEIKWFNVGTQRAYIRTEQDANKVQVTLFSGPTGDAGDFNYITIVAEDSTGANDTLIHMRSIYTANPGWIKMAAEGVYDFEIYAGYCAAINDLRVGEGLYVGGVAVNPAAGEIWCTGIISTDNNVNRWDLGGVLAGVPTPDRKVVVIINGATYHLSADLQP